MKNILLHFKYALMIIFVIPSSKMTSKNSQTVYLTNRNEYSFQFQNNFIQNMFQHMAWTAFSKGKNRCLASWVFPGGQEVGIWLKNLVYRSLIIVVFKTKYLVC